ncbi:glycosyltransferase family 92 protein [Trichonephila clavipes]|nr:glycosyltransferase family 92 protein [Trichonephila clavipes]
MKLRSPRPSFSMDYTPKQWIGLYNILILLLVAAMCGMVIYEVYDLNRKFVTIIDSSVVAIDLLATNLINSKMAPYWRIVNEDVSVYSAFFKRRTVDDSIILIIGTSSKKEMYVEDLRCIVKYDDVEDINIVEATYEKLSNCSTFLVSCPAKDNSSTPKKVILLSHGDTFSKKWIEIETIPSDDNQTGIAACVRPFDGNVSAKQIEEFVIFYEMIGLKNFFFYNYNATQVTIQYIHQLIDAGHSIHMFTWNKKMEPLNSCQISWCEYVQDCLHRALSDHNNVLTVGITDLFVPKYFNRLDLLKSYNNNSYAQLQVMTANYCNAPNQDVFYPSIRNMVFRGSFLPSNANYFLRPEMTAAIELYGSFPSKNIRKLTETLPEYKGVVRHLAKECDSNVTFDALAYKYFKLMDKSIVLEKARRNGMKKTLPHI